MSADRLQEAIDYHWQGYFPIPTKPRQKDADVQWRPYQTKQPTPRDLKRWWPPGTTKNIALLLGPACRILAINVNMKNGLNGEAALKGFHLPSTPTIVTPHGGWAYLFRVPDRERYVSSFRTHTSTRLFPADAIELRGAGGYQLVPTSLLDDGAYAFTEGWTAEALHRQCAELPPWALSLWMSLDREFEPTTAEPKKAEHAETTETARKTAVPPKDVTASPPNTKILEVGRARVILDTCSTPKCLKPKDVRSLFGDFDANMAVAELLHLPALGSTFLCILHPESRASMSLFRDRTSGAWKVKDWHHRGAYVTYGLADLYASRVLGREVRLQHKPLLTVWWLRALVAAKFLEPAEVPRCPMPLDVRPALRTLYEGWLLLLGCKWLYDPGKPSAFSVRFAMDWCGLSSHTVQEGFDQLIRQGYLRRAGHYQGMPLYVPGEP